MSQKENKLFCFGLTLDWFIWCIFSCLYYWTLLLLFVWLRRDL